MRILVAEDEAKVAGHIRRGLVEAGYRHLDVVQWLHQAREIGLCSSFLPRWNPVTRPELVNYLHRMMGGDPGVPIKSLE